MCQRGKTGLVAVLVLVCATAAFAEDIFQAARDGDVPQVTAMLDKDPGLVSTRDASWRTPLHVACQAGKAEVVRILLDKGADINADDIAGRTPLVWAAQQNRQEIVQYLLEHGADAHKTDMYGGNVLIRATLSKNTEILRLLIAKGISLETTLTGHTALHYAVYMADLPSVKLLVESGAEVNPVDISGMTPLDMAEDARQDEIAAYLRSKGGMRKFTLGKTEVVQLTGNVRTVMVPYDNHTVSCILANEAGVLLVDTGYEPAGRELHRIVEETGRGEAKYIISTHLHADHVDGNSLASENAIVIDFNNLEERLGEGVITKGEGAITGATGRSFDTWYAMNFGPEEIVIIPVPGMHSATDALVYLKTSGVVHMGSMLISEAFPYVRANPAGYPDFLATVLDVFPEGTIFVSGHARALSKAELAGYAKMVNDTIKVVREMIKLGKTPLEIRDAHVLRPWAEYGQCSHLPYLNEKDWVNQIFTGFYGK